MKTFLFTTITIRICAAFLALGAVATAAAQTPSLAENFFLKHLVGSWQAEGELDGKDGNKVKITEEWKASVTPENELKMVGSRTINDNSQTYVWTVTQDAATGVLTAKHEITADTTNTQTFEGLLSEADMSFQLTAFLGSNSSKIVLTDVFKDNDFDTLYSEVIFTDDQGATTLSGPITHKRVKP